MPHKPQASLPASPLLPEEDLQESFSLSSGPGGQHANKVTSRVTLRHIPTGLVVHCEEFRSQARNRNKARLLLAARVKLEEEKAAQRNRALRELDRRRKRPKPSAVKSAQIRHKRHRARIREGRQRPGAEAQDQ